MRRQGSWWDQPVDGNVRDRFSRRILRLARQLSGQLFGQSGGWAAELHTAGLFWAASAPWSSWFTRTSCLGVVSSLENTGPSKVATG
jgi:hypothetical protein